MAYFSNGTSGMIFQEDNCFRCANADEDGCCAIWDAHLFYNYDQHKDEKIKSILSLLIPEDGPCSLFREVSQ